MKKRIIAIVLMLALTMCAACSKKEAQETEPIKDPGTKTETEAPATTSAPADNGDVNTETPAATTAPEEGGDVNTETPTNEAPTGNTSPEGGVEVDPSIPMLDAMELKSEWKEDQVYELADPAPWNLDELKKVVDVNDPRSVAAYWVWAVTRLTDNYDDGMAMMKFLFADIEVYGSGYTEGGLSGMAGWDPYFNERLSDKTYKWLPRAYFDGCTKDNGFKPDRPLSIELYYNNTNTETINAQTLENFNRLNIVYWVQSYAGGNQVNIELSRFDGTNRWYVTKGTASTALFYMQPAAGGAENVPNDESTQAEHDAFYGSLN